MLIPTKEDKLDKTGSEYVENLSKCREIVGFEFKGDKLDALSVISSTK